MTLLSPEGRGFGYLLACTHHLPLDICFLVVIQKYSEVELDATQTYKSCVSCFDHQP